MSSGAMAWVLRVCWFTMSDMNTEMYDDPFVPDFEKDREIWEQYLDQQREFSEFREEMIARFPNTKLVVRVSQPNADFRLYGPFSNGADMCAWMALQPMNVRFMVVPLRNPIIRRTHDDFYNPAKDHDINDFIVDYGQNNPVTPNE